MNIVSAGSRFMVYGEDVQTYKILPPGAYKVEFSQMRGFSLSVHNDLLVKEKMYGTSYKKADKVMNTFNHLDRNMGVILSGPKGVGKTMFARRLAELGKEQGLPLILVDAPYPGIEDFIESIEQECIVLFDEFEKTFRKAKEEEGGPQERLLSLFDGIDGGKKLYVITCNRVSGLNEYFLNRPGRFHYHFILSTPTGDEVREYMEDNLDGDARKYIDNIVTLSSMSAFTYDVLRAIAFELNLGNSLSETMMDLNIERERYLSLRFKIVFTNGVVATTREGTEIDIFNNRYISAPWLYLEKNDIVPKDLTRYLNRCYLRFYTNDIIVSENGYHLGSDKVDIGWDDDWEYIDTENEAEKEKYDKIKELMDSFKVEQIIIEKTKNRMSSFDYKYLI